MRVAVPAPAENGAVVDPYDGGRAVLEAHVRGEAARVHGRDERRRVAGDRAGAPADADGACGVAAVRSVRSAPRETPAAFVATTR